MNSGFYLGQFEKAAASLSTKLLAKKQMEAETGVWLNSVVLRLQKKHWANKPFTKPQNDAAIFFSVWISDEDIKEKKILYNIHALKLRQLKGYKITSRAFVAAFRQKFKPFEKDWPKVRVDYGPLTLMQGWIPLNEKNIEKDVSTLAGKFLEIDFLIDELLGNYKHL